MVHGAEGDPIIAVISALVALALAASLAAAVLLYTLDFPALGTNHTLEDQ